MHRRAEEGGETPRDIIAIGLQGDPDYTVRSVGRHEVLKRRLRERGQGETASA